MSTVVCYIWITIVVSIAALYSGRRIPVNYVAKHIALPLGKTEYTSYNASFINQMQISGASDVLPLKKLPHRIFLYCYTRLFQWACLFLFNMGSLDKEASVSHLFYIFKSSRAFENLSN